MDAALFGVWFDPEPHRMSLASSRRIAMPSTESMQTDMNAPVRVTSGSVEIQTRKYSLS